MSKRTHNFKEGQRVNFSPQHNTALKLDGWVTGISDDHDIVDVQYNAGKDELPRIFQANAKDCSLHENQTPRPRRKDEKDETAA